MAVSVKEDEVPLTGSERRKKLPFKCNLGCVFNYAIALLQLAVLVTCMIVIGTIGGVQSHLKGYSDPQLDGNASLPRHACYMFSKCNGEPVDNSSQSCYFKPDKNSACEGAMGGFGIIGFGALMFFILSIVKGVLNLKSLNWTLFIELPVMVFLFILEFCLSVMISIGNLITCNSIKKFYNSNDCWQPFPYLEFSYNSLATTARNSSWFVFMFLFIALVLYTFSLIIFLRQKKKEKKQKNDLFIDSGKPPGFT